MNTFQQLDLIKPLQRALNDIGYEKPTEIQAKTIPHALEGLDVLGCAQTGTGKTAAFVLPILDYLGGQNGRASAGKPYVLILAPTRELAIQIGESIDTYGKHLKLRKTVVYGGVNQSSQVRSLNRGTDILVATPGRLLDLKQQGHISLERLEVFVLDEADRMLDMGFMPDLKRIIRSLPEERQSLFFSATLPPKITDLAKTLLFEPAVVNVTPKKRNVAKIRQQMLLVEKGDKQQRLQEILTEDSVDLAIVFTRTKHGANKVERKLKQQGISAGAIHGNKSQASRQRTLAAFRSGKVKVLVATDVAARGIDVNDVTHVINHDLPSDGESYVHRIGRTGRAGASGVAITFYTSDQRHELREIEQAAGLPATEVPQGKQQSKPQGKTSKKPARSGGQHRHDGQSGKPNVRNKSKRRKGSTSRSSTTPSAQTAQLRRKKKVASRGQKKSLHAAASTNSGS